MGSIQEELKNHEERIRGLENTVSEIKGELRINTALTLAVLGAVLSLIIIAI